MYDIFIKTNVRSDGEVDRVILHVDCNKFYASVECLYRPEIRDKPVVVGGSEKDRHGIVLTKNEIASKFGIKTAEPLWKAREKCPMLVVVPPNYPLYMEFSSLVNQIFYEYTDQIEPFGLDESWLDVTGSQKLFGSGYEIANEIRERIKKELGITVSIGVSFNKIFAKLGSDYKKPDAVTVFSRENFKEIVWSLNVEEMLFVGRATKSKLNHYSIKTIGDLANADVDFLVKILGKNGKMLYENANGNDQSAVKLYDFSVPCKSIGNSTTTPRDMITNQDVKLVLAVLSDSVARRMRKQDVKASTVTVHFRDNNLFSFTRQEMLPNSTNISSEILQKSMEIFLSNYNWNAPLRSIGVSVSGFDEKDGAVQMDLMGKQKNRQKLEAIEKTMDELRERFGSDCIHSANIMQDKELTSFNPHDDHTSFFHSYFK